MIGLRRLENLKHCLDVVVNDGIPGDCIECGVWRGGAAIFMRGVLKAYRGFVIVDDYGAISSCRLAVDDFRAEYGINEEIKWIDWTGVFWRRTR